MYVVQHHSAVHLKAVLNRFQVNCRARIARSKSGTEPKKLHVEWEVNSILSLTFLLFFGGGADWIKLQINDWRANNRFYNTKQCGEFERIDESVCSFVLVPVLISKGKLAVIKAVSIILSQSKALALALSLSLSLSHLKLHQTWHNEDLNVLSI